MIKTLDRYILGNFLYSYLLCFMVLMGLRTVADLFVNMDEFAKLDLPFGQLAGYVLTYYSYQVLAYFQELGGVIVVVAAAFSLARMNHTNELTAMLASGVSLHRVIWPVVLVGMALSGLSIANQELLIPRVKQNLARDRDDVLGVGRSQVRLMSDGQRNVWWSPSFWPADKRMDGPMILVRDSRFVETACVSGIDAVYQDDGAWRLREATVAIPDHDAVTTSALRSAVTPEALAAAARTQSVGGGRVSLYDDRAAVTISAETIDPASGTLTNVEIEILPPVKKDDASGKARAAGGKEVGPYVVDEALAADISWPRMVIRAASAKYDVPAKGGVGTYYLTGGELFVRSDLTPQELALRQSSQWMNYMSTSELNELLLRGKSSDDLSAKLIKHCRLTEPLANLVMLLLGLPFILSRERNIKASAGLCLLVVGACYMCVFMARYMGGYGLDPVLSAWFPILLFGPIAAVMLESVKT